MRTGLRINPQISQIDDERFDPCRKHSKLGEPASNLRRLKALPPGISGIHFHNTCEADDFSGLKPTIERLQCEIPHILAQISWINLGGGYGWCAPDAAGQLIEATALLRSTAIQDIYIEPGAALVRDGGAFVASVVDLIDTDGRTVAVLDTSVNHMPEVFEYSDLPGIEPEVLGHRDDLPAGEGFGYVLAGSTCLAGDLFGTYRSPSRWRSVRASCSRLWALIPWSRPTCSTASPCRTSIWKWATVLSCCVGLRASRTSPASTI